ncbi:MAG: geranylgeranylglycerol-phosphate geranylgeranyltransferase [Candidatus Bathyarchaeia archaeon]
MRKIVELFRLIRPINSALTGFAVIVGASLIEKNLLSIIEHLLLGFITGFTIAGAAMTINDYFDREIDAINQPNRPIPKGTVKPKEALCFAFLLSLVGLSAALATNLQCFFLALAGWILSCGYAAWGKRTGFLGDLLVSLGVTIPFLYGNFIAENSLAQVTVIFASMAFLSNAGREVTKEILDIEGDKAQNVKTVAVTFGERKTAVLASIFYFAAVSLTPLPLAYELVSFWFIPPVALTDLGLIMSAVSLLRNSSKENAKKVKNQVLACFLLGLVAFITGTIT